MSDLAQSIGFAVAALVIASYLLGRAVHSRSSSPLLYHLSKRTRQSDYDLRDNNYQLRVVTVASFKKKRILNGGEYRAFRVIEQEVIKARKGYRVFAQTNLGEILYSPIDDAFRSINSKRVDILVVDPRGWPALAVEVQGAGHNQGNAAARDAVKKEALQQAGVGFMEVFETDSDQQVRSRLCQHLGWETAAVRRARSRSGNKLVT